MYDLSNKQLARADNSVLATRGQSPNIGRRGTGKYPPELSFVTEKKQVDYREYVCTLMPIKSDVAAE